MHGFLHDLRHAVRVAWARPAFSVVAVLMLGLGIAGATLMFAVANALLWRPFSYDPESRIVTVLEVARGRHRSPTSPANFLDWRAATTLEAMTAAHPWSPTMTGRERAERLVGLKASPSLFELLEARPLIGTTFSPGSAARDSHVVVLGYDLWRRAFGGDRSIVGRTVILDGEPYTVAGVMPPGFAFPPFWHTGAGFWAPLVFTPDQEQQRGARMLRVFARLRDGRSVTEAQHEMRVLQGRLARVYPRENADVGVEVEPLLEPAVGERRTIVLALLGAVGFVLLIACANVANLLLARATTQQGEVAVRQALGAGAWRLVRQQIAHALVLATGGAVMGVALVWWGLRALSDLFAERLPRGRDITLDLRVLGFALAALVATTVLVSLLPAVHAGRVDVVARLRGGLERGTTSRAGPRWWIVAGQLALAFTLLAGTGLMLRTIVSLNQADPGFSREHVLSMNVALPKAQYANVRRQAAFLDEAQQRIARLPGVRRAGFVNHLPIGGDTWGTEIVVEGDGQAAPGEERHASYRAATPGYFAAIGIRLTAGRDFRRTDTADSGRVGVVNERFVRQFLGGTRASAVGRRVALGQPEGPDRWITIVGVVADAHQVSLRDEPGPEIYLPATQNPVAWFTSATAVVCTAGDPLAARRAVEQVLGGLEPDAPITDVRTTAQVLDSSVAGTQLSAWLLTVFGIVALVLASVGLYGAVAYSVGVRRREFGIRMALGATRSGVVATVLREVLSLVVVGGAAGLAGAVLLSRVLAGALFGVSPGDPTTHLVVAGVLVATALLAAAIPALSAGRLDPARALRNE